MVMVSGFAMVYDQTVDILRKRENAFEGMQCGVFKVITLSGFHPYQYCRITESFLRLCAASSLLPHSWQLYDRYWQCYIFNGKVIKVS